MSGENELVIGRIPGRSGLYLGTMVSGNWRSIARFTRGDQSAKEFVAWAQRAGIRYQDTTGDKEEQDGQG